jgi:glycine cleavage system aminomethyltransferase T
MSSNRGCGGVSRDGTGQPIRRNVRGIRIGSPDNPGTLFAPVPAPTKGWPVIETRTQPFDMSLVQRGARNRRTPYYEATQRYGPKGFTVYNHMYFPIRFDTFEAEFDALLNDVTIWDVSVERCLEISGPDGFRFAQLLTPRDLSKCAVGQAKYVLICDSDGGIVNDPVLTRMDENTFWFALASSDALLFARGLRNAYPDLDVTIQEADVAPLQVQGPKSKDLIRDLVGESILDLKYYWWRKAEIRGIPVVITRTGWTSEVGYEIYLLDGSKGAELWEALMEVGAPYNVRPTGPSDIRRIEGAIFNWGADMTYENNAFEMGLERLVDFGLADDASISIAALRRIKDAGVERRIVGVELDGEPFPALNNTKWPAYAEGGNVGKVTSAIYSPRLRKNIGYCWLPVSLAGGGTAISVETEWGTRNARVVPMPFVDPEKRIPVS